MPLYALGERTPVCAPDTWVADNATLIGSVVLESCASVFFGAVLRGDTDLISIGARSNIQDNAVLHTDAGIPLTLGKRIIVGHQAMLHGCTVGDGALIGIGAIILNNAQIGAHSIVAAGAVIPEGKIYPPYSLILGSPGKVVRQLSEAEAQALMQGADHYVARWQSYLGQLRRIEP
ncbi:MAG: gamma carbonic anhydrase family protein [Sterolibacterium sp.]|jgi:carbonic anhydrase/acetyltransferase-like protein (isoleucine patch superfamily)|nr:gamma carbonic anhydrase family protein [Sterolibacterium sp.]